MDTKRLITSIAIVAAVFLSAFVAIELTVQKPLVNLRLLKSRNFGIGVRVNILMGFALFGTVYVLPQYLGQVQRYNAEQIGNVLAWTALPQLLLIPLVPLLMKRFDVRYIGALGIGWLGRRGRHDVAVALALVAMLGLGALFLSFSVEYAPEIYSLLFG